MVENYLSGWKNIVNFSGKATRAEFWTFSIVNWVLNFLLSGLLGGIVGLVVGILLFIANLAIGTRRFHDIKKSGWNWLWAFLPLIGWIILLVFWLTPSK
jgi:uncharacterized membrane protein YhaH (DUF805 family)